MGGGTTGQIQRAAKKQSTRKASWASADQYRREKMDTSSLQHNIGQASGDMYDSFQMGMSDAQEIIRRNTESLPGTKGPYKEKEDTSSSEANYTSSSSGSKSGGQGGKKQSNLKEKKNKQNLSKKALIKKK